MAKFVIAGKADCPSYARAEALADQLANYLPDFRVHKVKTRHCSVKRYFNLRVCVCVCVCVRVCSDMTCACLLMPGHAPVC